MNKEELEKELAVKRFGMSLAGDFAGVVESFMEFRFAKDQEDKEYGLADFDSLGLTKFISEQCQDRDRYIAIMKEVQNLKVPSEYDGKPVGRIFSCAFKNNNLLVNVSIPDSVKTVGIGAFGRNTNLKNVFCQSENIEHNAFDTCTQLEKVELLNAKFIGSNAFRDAGLLNNSAPIFKGIPKDCEISEGSGIPKAEEPCL